MKLNNDDCSGVLEYLGRLVQSVRPKQHPLGSRLRRRSWKLRRILTGVQVRLEGKAVKKQPGLAGILYTELSGDAGLAIFRRLDAACSSAEKAPARPEPSFQVAARGRGGRGRGYNSGDRDRDLSHITCHGCWEKGHFRDKCPFKGQPPKKQ